MPNLRYSSSLTASTSCTSKDKGTCVALLKNQVFFYVKADTSMIRLSWTKQRKSKTVIFVLDGGGACVFGYEIEYETT